jgi:hypothetical protein
LLPSSGDTTANRWDEAYVEAGLRRDSDVDWHQEVEAEQRAGKPQESLEKIGPPFVAHAKSATAEELGECPLHHPAVPSQALRGVDPTAGDACGDAASMEGAAEVGRIVRLVAWSLAGRLRGRPGFPLGQPMDGMASMSGSN